jgi:hypothetical protein
VGDFLPNQRLQSVRRVPASVTVLAFATVFLERRFVRGADAERSGSYSVMG